MNPDCAFVPPDESDDMLLERLRSAAEFLELIDVNRGLLDRLPAQIANGSTSLSLRSTTPTLQRGVAGRKPPNATERRKSRA